MKEYEAWIHNNGALVVKAIPAGCLHAVDLDGPMVYKYLGKKYFISLNNARRYFIEQNGGKKYMDIDPKIAREKFLKRQRGKE